MPGIIGKKIGMIRLFDKEYGRITPCTLIEGMPCVVTQLKTKTKDGYEAVQLACHPTTEKRTTKPLIGHFKKSGQKPQQHIAEFTTFSQALKLGDTVTVSHFKEGQYIHVVGTSKGKGFQGVVKRHNFHGASESTHGHKHILRAPGSIGACSTPSRVFKGTRMAGRMGGKRTKIRNLKILKILPEKNLLIVKGSIPGPNTGRITITN